MRYRRSPHQVARAEPYLKRSPKMRTLRSVRERSCATCFDRSTTDDPGIHLARTRSNDPEADEMTEILEGVRILEVAEHTFVPAASALLADWGADVVKIEHVERGDAMRGLASTSPSSAPGCGRWARHWLCRCC